ncbi:MAG: bifunctional adenosylcobinamide kinase/adenosylcobinamide-phosphate guanylyltransferase [Hyphomicrobiaceae bacterium]|nr:bifunctional adenosylcobinamide kinase/adenosylcobinamide-phosphate guanylyltransferase [Hyphomicrobiaceae bacterium]
MAVTLVLGGARSGKSQYAEGLISALPSPWIYLATGEAGDGEMQERIAEHQARRGPNWVTREAPLQLAQTLRDAGDRPVLVDCLTLWVSNLMHAEHDVASACGELGDALMQRRAETVLVSNEVGLGIVPVNALARRFRDEAGRVNQKLARIADRVVFMVAGLPMIVK